MNTPTRIIWQESSGAVAPPYQYSIDLEIIADDEGATVSLREKRGTDAAANKSLKISRERFDALWREIESQNAETLNRNLIADPNRIGVSRNHFEAQFPDNTTVRFDYHAAQLRRPEFAAHRAVIESLKRFADELRK